MKVTTDGCLFGAWASARIASAQLELKNCLDIGAGSGLLSLMIAQKNNINIDAIEIDSNAAVQAKQNVAASAWSNQINVITQDVLTWQTAKQYDCIVSNPPFYESELKSGRKTKNLAHHDEGLKLPQLFSFIKSHLTEEGTFFLLLPAKRAKEIDSLLKQENLYQCQRILVKQTPNHQPFRLMIRGGKKEVGQVEATTSVKDENDKYTPAFTALLKDYYLYL
ncbi:tRNA1(Val) (adenine(37)-N6)-methyltransferase [Flavisolibacter ginsenosidimutans]|nr:methyltransferase [Flavisolibacter ginsenosidimutans]